MAKDLHELIQQKPELFKTALQNPEISTRVIAMINGIQQWGKRHDIGIKHIKITGPIGPTRGYDASFKIGRKLNGR